MLGSNFTKTIVVILLFVVGATMTSIGVQGALATLPKALHEIERVEICINLYRQILDTPDLLANLDKITLSTYNLNAAKEVSKMSSLDLIQSITLVKYCIYNNINSLADISFEIIGSIIYNLEISKIKKEKITKIEFLKVTILNKN